MTSSNFISTNLPYFDGNLNWHDGWNPAPPQDVEFPAWPYKKWYTPFVGPTKQLEWTTTVTVAEEPMNNLTDITVLIDESGSMADKMNDVIGGYNNFLKEQRENEAPCKLSLITFNNQTKIISGASDLKYAKSLSRENFRPSGATALLDALKEAIEAATERTLMSRPSKVVFVIFTDGEENASRKTTLNAMKDLVKRRQLAGWEFVFMGADIDAFSTGQSFGALQQFTSNVANSKISDSYASMSGNISLMRSGNKLDSSFTAEQQAFLSQN